MYHLSRKVERLAVKVADRAWPKDDNLWLFVVAPGKIWGGNLQALFEYVRQERGIDARILVGDPDTARLPRDLEPLATMTRSRAGLQLLMRSRVVLLQYHCHDFVWREVSDRRRVICNLWHGVHLKGLGCTDATLRPKNRRKVITDASRYAFFAASSATHQQSLIDSFRMSPSVVQITGLPRNDWLLANDEALPDWFLEQQQRLLSQLNGRRLVLYAPTFREGSDGVYDFTDSQLSAIQDVLDRHGCVLGVRGHINRAGAARKGGAIHDCGSHLYPEAQVLLRNAAVLVTDYSGIWVDYLLMNRPIVGFCYDWDDYMNKRGLIYDYAKVFPGAISRDVESLARELGSALADGMRQSRAREASLDMFHRYRDPGACGRAADAIRSLVHQRS